MNIVVTQQKLLDGSFGGGEPRVAPRTVSNPGLTAQSSGLLRCPCPGCGCHLEERPRRCFWVAA